MPTTRSTRNAVSIPHRKRRLPFRYNPTIGRQRAKALRIKRKGLALPDDKASLRAIGEHANAEHKRR